MVVTGLPAAPLLLGFILGPLMEIHLRRALLISNGDFSTTYETWVSTGFLLATLLILFFSVRRAIGNARVARIKAKDHTLDGQGV